MEEDEEKEEIWSWGAGTDGQLGTGRLEDELIPQLLQSSLFSAASPISTLACGGAHVLALTSDGKVITWGRGTSGQLGHGDILSCSQPSYVKSLDNFAISYVSAGWAYSAFVSDGGRLFTCGDGSFGQLGHGTYESHCSPVEVSFFGSKTVEQIACGMRHSLVLLKGGSIDKVYGFGSGKRGQLGISKEKVRSICSPQAVSGFGNIGIVSISANGDHSAALSADGHLFTWGRSFNSKFDECCPQNISSSLQFTQVALGWSHALALTSDGEVFMLGGRQHGMLSDPQKSNNVKLVSESSGEAVLEKVLGLDGVKVEQIAAGSGVIKTWGWGEHGQLGLGNTLDQTSPQVVGLGCQHRIRNPKSKID
ncbi:Regulator of chromosome condensation, RCC1 [Dillenia turbinata]|uniref:Regulator of chromosome condensation, RCC1 n=1 Tax=Dillenia turbinata TaxID=194707 RepID=A0AAN8UWL9_9MAGN